MTPKRRKILRRTLITLVVLILGVWIIGPRVAAPLIRARLQHMVAEQLNADLTIGDLSYSFPYGVNARNVALVARDDSGKPLDLLRVKELQLALAEIPWGDGPLIIKNISVREPSVHLIRTDIGVVGVKDLLKDELRHKNPRKPGKEKPSDYFRLRHFEIRDGEIVTEDRRPGKSADPVVWKNLTIEMNTQPTSGSLYTYDVSGKNVPLATANVRGQIDIDTLNLDVEKYVLGIKAEPGAKYAVLPPHLRDFLEANEIEGSLTLSGTAHVPLKEPWLAMHESVLDMPSGRALLSKWDGRLDRMSLKLRISSELPPELSDIHASSTASPATTAPGGVASATLNTRVPPLYLSLNHIEIVSGDTTLQLDKGAGISDPATGQWRLADLIGRVEIGQDRRPLPTPVEALLNKLNLTGKLKFTATASGPLRPKPGSRFIDSVDYRAVAYPRDVALHVPKWPLPLTNLSGAIRANKEVITLENVEGSYGEDRFFVTAARIPLVGIDQAVRIEEISGSVLAAGKPQPYPRFLDWAAKNLRPAGTFFVNGSFARRKGLQPGEKPEFHFDIRTDGAHLAVARRSIPVTDVRAEISATPQLVDVKRIEGRSLGGDVTVECQLTPGKGADLTYQGIGFAHDVDVRALGQSLSSDGKPPKRLSGRGSLNTRFSGAGPHDGRTALDQLRADGRFEVLDGEFWEIPVVKQISNDEKITRDPLTVGQAAGVFEIKDQVVHLKQVAISATVLGLQGDGDVGFDKSLDLHVVAAPLADWKDQMKRTKVPIVSDVAGEVLGGLQKLLDTASKTLLYEFRVKGTTNDPKIETVPAPVLTDAIANVFGAMLKDRKLSDVVKDPNDTPRKK